METSERLVIAITGSPGVGKSTVAHLLSERLGALHIDLSKLPMEEGFVEDWDERRETAIVELEAVKEEMRRLLERHEKVIVEGHYAHDVVPPGSWIFVLRRAPWRLREELERRDYPPEKVRENVEAELLDICLCEAVETHGAERVHEVDTTNRTMMEVVREIEEVVWEMRPVRIRSVDWLSRPEAETLLEWLRDVSRR